MYYSSESESSRRFRAFFFLCFLCFSFFAFLCFLDDEARTFTSSVSESSESLLANAGALATDTVPPECSFSQISVVRWAFLAAQYCRSRSVSADPA
jgi:hypothetical protein